MTTIVAFGNFDLVGGRSWIIRQGLAEAGYELELCRTDAKGIVGKWRDLRRKWHKVGHKPDALYVPFLGHWILPLAWRLARRGKIPLVFDAFLSLHDTEVHDRRRLSSWSPRAWFLWWTDWLCCRLCDAVLLDTEEHKQYFVDRYGVRPEKILVLPIGCRTDMFVPLQVARETAEPFSVEFHGTFIPLQGIETILGAAKLLQEKGEHIRFTLAGKGQTFGAMRALAQTLGLRNVEFPGAIPMEEIPVLIARADVCLGIFGVTAKTGRVIPNKAYETLNCGKPLITGDTAAARQVFRDRENVLLCRSGDPTDLAEKLMTLKRDPALRKNIAENGHRLSLERFQPRAIVAPLLAWLEGRLHG